MPCARRRRPENGRTRGFEAPDTLPSAACRREVRGKRFCDHELTERRDPDSLNADRFPNGSVVHAARANRGDVIHILRKKRGVKDGTDNIRRGEGVRASRGIDRPGRNRRRPCRALGGADRRTEERGALRRRIRSWQRRVGYRSCCFHVRIQDPKLAEETAPALYRGMVKMTRPRSQQMLFLMSV